MTSLSPEDTLRLNSLILLCDAIRIDEYKMLVVGLDKNKKERQIQLHPDGDHAKYLAAVRELLVAKVLGSMGGYPSYLKRWNRMGQVSLNNLQSLLKIGNIEAVIAVANSQNIPDDILPLVWWSATNTDECAEIALYLLKKPEVLAHPVKLEIADYLLEFLPFITQTNDLINTVNLLLQPNLIPEAIVEKLWKQGQRKTIFLVGFLERRANNLPFVGIKPLKVQAQNIEHLDHLNTEQGQLFLQTCALILKKINDETVLYRTLDALGNYCKHPLIKPSNDLKQLQTQTTKIMQNLSVFESEEKIQARLLLAGVNEALFVSQIAKHSLVGSVIRKKLKTTFEPIQSALTTLLS